MERPRRPSSPSRAERLALDVAAGHPEIVAELAEAIAASARVRDFVTANAAKIRRKVRDATGPDTLLDVRAELAVPLRLLADRRFDVAWEPAGAKTGGPDFELVWRVNTHAALEVTRRRDATDADAVVAAAIAKRRQLRAGVPNVLVVAVDVPPPTDELDNAFTAIRRQVDARDPGVLAFLHAATPRDVYEQLDRLAAVVAWRPGSTSKQGSTGTTAWRNRAARHQLPPGCLDALTAVLTSKPG